MNVEWTAQHVVFSEMDDFMADALRKIPVSAGACEDEVIARIFPLLTDGADDDADEDWREHVVPGLNELFQSHLDVVSLDLTRMQTDGDVSTLAFPTTHARAWMHALNQARLALGALHDVTEDDMEGRAKNRGIEKAYALFQIEIYGFILSLMLHHAEL